MGKMFEVISANDEVPAGAVLNCLLDTFEARWSALHFKFDTVKLYAEFVAEIKHFETLQFEIWKTEGSTPAWRFVYHVLDYVKSSADDIMRNGLV
jgi:hypothetical protein